MKTLSIIMPVYNGENYIDTSIGSVLSQNGIDRNELELILIDDGSTDGSITKLKKYADDHTEMIRLVSRANRGAANSRNEGIQLASGKYITFLDQDDSIDDNFAATLLTATRDSDVDVVHSGFKHMDMKGQVRGVTLPKKVELGLLFAIPAWAKIYKKSFIKQNNITFYDNNIGEDNVFTLNVFLAMPEYRAIKYAGYNNFYDNQQSVTNSLHKGLSESVKILDLLKKLNEPQPKDARLQKTIHYNIVRTATYYLLSYGKNATAKRFSSETATLFDWIAASIPRWMFNRFIWFSPRGESLTASIGVKLLGILVIVRAVPLFAKFYCKGNIT